MPMPTTATYDVRIDFFADQDYTDAIDDVSDRVLGNPGLTVEYGRDTARSTAPPMIGIADFALNNQDRELSPENPQTQRYQYIRPGRPVQITTYHGIRGLYRAHTLYREHDPYRGAGSYPLCTGHTSRFTQHSDFGGKTVDVSVLGTISRLRRRIVSIALIGFTGIGIRTDTAVGMVLDAAGWPAAKRRLSVSESLMRGWWADERNAWDMLVELLATEGAGACMFEEPDGTFVWQNRNYRAASGRSTTSQVTLHDGTGATGIAYSRLEYDPRWEDVVNRVTVATKQRVLDASATVIWKLGTTITATAVPQIIWARPQDPFQAAITPVLTTDYTVSGGTVSITLEWANGAVAKISVVATSGSPIVSDLQLRAYSFPSVGETQIEASVAAGTEDEEKTLRIAAWPEMDPNHATALCTSYLTRYQDSRPMIAVTFQNINGVAMEHILRLQISDRVTISNAHLGIDTAAYIEKIRHGISTGGRHEITLTCEPVSSIGSLGSLWDTGTWNAATWGI